MPGIVASARIEEAAQTSREAAAAPPPAESCSGVPQLWNDFVDAFVDFTVGGHVLSRRRDDVHDKPKQHIDPNALDPKGSCVEASGDAKENVSKSANLARNGFLQPAGSSIRADVKSARTSRADEDSLRLPAADRLVAVGDVHGDVSKLREALMAAGLIDGEDRWTGKSTVLVQVGDQLDRGGEELKVLFLLEKLKREAQQVGGAVHVLLGNHETGNIEGWFRYVFPDGFREFQRWAAWERLGNGIKASCSGLARPSDPLAWVPSHIPPHHRARFAALTPGGPIARRFLANNRTVLIIGDTVFVHGGVLPEHVDYGLEQINQEAKDWILGKHNTDKGPQLRGPDFFHTRRAIVWAREYSEQDEKYCKCDLLKEVLDKIGGAKRMVVGHTIQSDLGVNFACDKSVARVDVGMSKGCGDGKPQVLEILRNGEVMRVLSMEERPKVLHEAKEQIVFVERFKQRIGEVMSSGANRA